ncbi:MAG: hypothetical protein CL908_24640 [Deltaproteobacteria bacterium]|jgi:hypothetical protein|nr:hypothetical protein [Deltaproteobacteria bacterium]
MSTNSSDVYFPEGMPRPTLGDDTRPFWEACRQHRLLVQRCAECGAHRSPPKPVCWRCGSFEATWTESSGRGRVFAYTIVHHSPHPVAKVRLPYNIAVIELEDCDGVLLTSNIVRCPEDALRVDLRVEVVWEDRSDGQSLYRFRPTTDPCR